MLSVDGSPDQGSRTALRPDFAGEGCQERIVDPQPQAIGNGQNHRPGGDRRASRHGEEFERGARDRLPADVEDNPGRHRGHIVVRRQVHPLVGTQSLDPGDGRRVRGQAGGVPHPPSLSSARGMVGKLRASSSRRMRSMDSSRDPARLLTSWT